MEIILSPIAEKKLDLLLEYIELNWGISSKEKFIRKLEKEFMLLSLHPYKNKRTETFPELYNCVVTKQTSIIYRVIQTSSVVEIVTLFDNRQDNQELLKEIKKYFNL
ncbi:type II toxin-antitoxin system RelE/ParE family toxin [Salibacter sp.]|uniref:type II toxin-antitoxin system RelE/ParE family toxin n=1 Tax=Salibacter sp. TaxID=2010995 RepID=UPI002870A973|nr:type II toxin-antitoxin system RelE/ParE family toxin [Salibacter sp.]MDR9398994.1 type II toxin-antitoxin system RelE/ParE family toxin [Salibacter sp.]MDR9487061.1 type II toxin-antitoxin system RelE/ParE family toxin [Salibacter sp.]